MCSREVVKRGILQKKVRKKQSKLGTITRKKQKFMFEEPLWVVLCIHDNNIPFLEWYRQDEHIKKHEPIRVIDLLYANYIMNVISDDRCFLLGFRTPTDPLEFAALDNRQRTEWVQAIHNTLSRLEIFDNNSNVYGGAVKSSSPPPPLSVDTILNIVDHPHTTISPTSSHNMSRDEQNTETSPRHSENGHTVIVPGSPNRAVGEQPERVDGSSSPEYSSLSSIPTDGSSHPVASISQQNIPQSPIPALRMPTAAPRRSLAARCSPPSSKGKPPAIPPRSDSADMSVNRQRNLVEEEGVYDLPRSTAALTLYESTSPVGSSACNASSSSPITSTLSTTSLCSSSDSHESSCSRAERHIDLRFTYLGKEFLDDGLHHRYRRASEHVEAKGFFQPLRKTAVSLNILVEHVLFVEVGGRVWVAGWRRSLDRQLSCLFRIGDELVEVEDHPVTGIHNIPHLFYALSSPGALVSLTIRPIPNAITFKLVRPINNSTSIGVLLHKGKNRIGGIEQDSQAFRRGLPIDIASFFQPEGRSPAVITEVNNRRLNPFAKNDQPLARISTVREGVEFSLTLQPHDFIKEMKNQIKKNKAFRIFMCDS